MKSKPPKSKPHKSGRHHYKHKRKRKHKRKVVHFFLIFIGLCSVVLCLALLYTVIDWCHVGFTFTVIQGEVIAPISSVVDQQSNHSTRLNNYTHIPHRTPQQYAWFESEHSHTNASVLLNYRIEKTGSTAFMTLLNAFYEECLHPRPNTKHLSHWITGFTSGHESSWEPHKRWHDRCLNEQEMQQFRKGLRNEMLNGEFVRLYQRYHFAILHPHITFYERVQDIEHIVQSMLAHNDDIKLHALYEHDAHCVKEHDQVHFISWLRHPVDRIISEFYYMRGIQYIVTNIYVYIWYMKIMVYEMHSLEVCMYRIYTPRTVQESQEGHEHKNATNG